MNKNTKLTLGIILVVLVTGSMATAAYAAPLTTQDQQRIRDQLRDPTQCPNFVDEDGDGICDNCPEETGTGLGRQSQYRHGWGS